MGGSGSNQIKSNLQYLVASNVRILVTFIVMLLHYYLNKVRRENVGDKNRRKVDIGGLKVRECERKRERDR